ncbi:MAG: class F sortase [Jiangellales bacterium]
MSQRTRALVALVASIALLVGSGVAWSMGRSSGVGTDLEQVTVARVAADSAASRGPQRPTAPTSQAGAQTSDRNSSDDAVRPGIDIPVVDATEIVIPDPVAPPLRLRVDSVGIDMPIAATGVAQDGQMELPDDPQEIGWYQFGASPGDRRGSAVLGGHVDSVAGGIGPLARLASVQVGDTVTVAGSDGAPVDYRVENVQRITKAALPVDTLFRPGGRHQLAVVTCGGQYIPEAGGYEDNIVVIATPVER